MAKILSNALLHEDSFLHVILFDSEEIYTKTIQRAIAINLVLDTSMVKLQTYTYEIMVKCFKSSFIYIDAIRDLSRNPNHFFNITSLVFPKISKLWHFLVDQ